MTLKETADRALVRLRDLGFGGARVAVVLGSGLAPLADALDDPRSADTASIPGFPRSTVAGHEGFLLQGTLGGRETLVLKGRVHGYEGYDLATVGLPVRLMALLGARVLVVTNAAGGIAEAFEPGDVMLIEDHLNLHGLSPLRGPNVDDWGPRFPDMSTAYDPLLRRLCEDRARARGLELRRGVYASVPGPQYETPAEVRMLRALGADAVGMSSVPEVIVARHMSMRVLGLSVITNAAAGLKEGPLRHEDVIAAGAAAGRALSELVQDVIAHLPESET